MRHQVTYLGLEENVRVRRAGFAYRADFHRFVERFAVLCDKTWPVPFNGPDRQAASAILWAVKKSVKIDDNEAQLGRTKVFTRRPSHGHRVLLSAFLIWQARVGAHLADTLQCYSEPVAKAFRDALAWLSDWACSRSFGLGTKIA